MDGTTVSEPAVSFCCSASVGKLAAALSAAQGEIEHARASSQNPHYKSRYADLSEVIDACRVPLSKHQIARVQAPQSRNGETGIRTMLIHSSGEWICADIFCKPERPGPQALGSVLTYLRRYSLAAAVGLAQDDDDGEAGQGRARPQQRKAAPISAPAPEPEDTQAATKDLVPCWRWSEEDAEWIELSPEPKRTDDQNAKLHALRSELGVTDEQWRSKLLKFSKESSAELSVREASKLIDALETRKARHGTAADKRAKQWDRAINGDSSKASAQELADYMLGTDSKPADAAKG